MHKTILIFGGTGYVGSAILDELIRAGHSVVLYCRTSSRLPAMSDQVRVVYGDMQTLAQDQFTAMQIDTIVYSIGLLRENARDKFVDFHINWLAKTIELARNLDIPNFILISANGSDNASTAYERTKLAGERLLQSSSLNWTILRPSIVLGQSAQYHFGNVIKQLLTFPIIPMIGNGEFLFTPVDRHDLGRLVSGLVANQLAARQILPIGGTMTLSFKHLVQKYAKQWHKRIIIVHIPLIFLKVAAYLLGRFPIFPVTSDQLTMLVNGNSVTDRRVWQIAKLEPVNLDETISKY
jgi:NADH dehydrogenase